MKTALLHRLFPKFFIRKARKAQTINLEVIRILSSERLKDSISRGKMPPEISSSVWHAIKIVIIAIPCTFILWEMFNRLRRGIDYGMMNPDSLLEFFLAFKQGKQALDRFFEGPSYVLFREGILRAEGMVMFLFALLGILLFEFVRERRKRKADFKARKVLKSFVKTANPPISEDAIRKNREALEKFCQDAITRLKEENLRYEDLIRQLEKK